MAAYSDDFFLALFPHSSYPLLVTLRQCSSTLLFLLNDPHVVKGLCQALSIITCPPNNVNFAWFREQYIMKYHPRRSLVPLHDIIRLAIANNDSVAWVNSRECLIDADKPLGAEITWMALCNSRKVFDAMVELGIEVDGFELNLPLDEVLQMYACDDDIFDGSWEPYLSFAVISGMMDVPPGNQHRHDNLPLYAIERSILTGVSVEVISLRL